ncbi:putative Unc104-like kinesin [Trypanosoma theileri]|uniref:Putative Unc104-like kinesin n=1 Tax=Trypanosoma theileri TaxID=67003 RepID=A0A1X0NZQ2_9TRYP|nr:putative Unc104-like kinesin [Trypanosoma theileri]ORC90166.1 putative Unc104-like kinesin [Trypanosoma theileri]
MSLQRDLVKSRRRSPNPRAYMARPPLMRKPNSAGSGGRSSPSGEAVHVAVRVRPPFRGEAAQEIVVAMDPSHKTVHVKDRMDDQQVFSVDMPVWSCVGKALDGSAPISQATLYEMVGRPLLDHALDGFNSTLMAYGQTGSGKTYTMMGDISLNLDDNEDVLNNSEEGIIPRLCREMFQQIQNRSFTASSGGTISWEVHVSFVEVYCEKISDLLNHGSPVSLRDEVVDNETFFTLVGARRIQVTNTADILKALKIGNKCRKTAATAMNERSSRSHAIFIVELTEILSFTNPDGDVVSAPSKSLSIRLVDLAGSERIGETGTSGQQFKEGVEINLSLFTLGMVIESLSDPKRRNIKPPYRESTLTKILKDAFGGNSKTTMICTISPTEAQRGQTIQTLQYGSKARRVVNKPHVEVDPSSVALRKANEEMMALRQQLSEVRRGSEEYAELQGQVQNIKERLRQEQEISRRRKANLEQKEAELAEHFQKMEEQRQMYNCKIQELGAEVERVKVKHKEKEQELQKTKRKVESVADERVRELEAQRELMEKEFKRKGDEMLQKQRETEERLQKLDNVFKNRVDKLVQLQKDLENVLKEKEHVVHQRERELQERQRHHEEKVRLLQQQMAAKEKEWMEKQKAVEEEWRTREKNYRHHLEEALKKSRLMHEESTNRENELHRKYLEAQRAAQQLKEGSELKELELKRQIEEIQREAQQQEREFNEKLSQAEHDAKIQCETLQRELEATSASTLGKERNMEVHWALLEEGLKKREESLQKREAEANARLNDALRMKQEWEREQREKMAEADARQEEAIGVIRSKEILVQQRENELKTLAQQLEAQAAAQEIEAKRKEHELSSKISETELLSSRERRAAQRLQDELQNALDRLKTEMKQREEQLASWEEESKKRYAQLENSLAEREAVIKQREADVEAQEREFLQRRPKEGDSKFAKEIQESIGDIVLEKGARSETATMFEADLKARLASMNCNTGDFVTCLRVSEEVLLHRDVGFMEATESQEREALIKHEKRYRNIIMEHVILDRRNMKLQKRENVLVSEEKKFIKEKMALQSFMQFLLIEMEQRCRILLESSRNREYNLIYTLETSTRRPRGVDVESVESHGLEREVQMRMEGLCAEEGRLTQRIADFAAERAAWGLETRRHDEALRAYIFELEALDRAEVQQREAEGRAVWTYLLELEAADIQRGQRERGLVQMEKDIAKQLTETERQLQERTADINRRRHEASVLAEENERTLQDQEDDLAALVAKNEEVEKQIKLRETELQQQRLRYVDLRKLLEERDALLRREHAHRMDGKDSATQLTDDLLDVNDLLKNQLHLWMKKYEVLKSDEKLECERCSWQNNRDATVCRCCGNAQLV